MNEAEQDNVIKIVSSLAGTYLDKLPDDAAVADVFTKACKGAFTEWFATPAQGLIAASIAAVVGWLKKKDRHDDAEQLLYEGKIIFALMNNPQGLIALINEAPCEAAELRPIGIKPLWDAACEEAGRDPVTGRTK